MFKVNHFGMASLFDGDTFYLLKLTLYMYTLIHPEHQITARVASSKIVSFFALLITHTVYH